MKKKSRVVFESDTEGILASGEKLEVKIHRFVELLSAYLSGAAVSALLYEPEAEQLALKSSSLRLSSNGRAFRFDAGGTVAALAIKESRVVSLRETDRPSGSALEGSYHFFPMSVGEGGPGVVTVQVVEEGGLGPVQMDVCRKAVTRLGEVVSREKRDAETSQKLMKTAAINEAGVTLVSHKDLSELLQTTTAITALIMGAESSVIRIFSGGTGSYLVRDCYGLGSENRKRGILDLDRLALDEVLASRRPLLARDLSAEERFRAFAGITSTFISHPLLDEGDIFGTISIFGKQTGDTFAPPYFTDADLANLATLARYISRAVSGAMAEEEAAALRDRDELTGLPDSGYFADRLRAEVSRASRFDGKMVVLTCETSLSSHAEGLDEKSRYRKMIRAVADAVRNALREYDIVASVGEGKFAMILPEADDGSVSATVRIRHAVEQTVSKFKVLLPDTHPAVSFSTTRFPEDAGDADTILENLNVF